VPTAPLRVPVMWKSLAVWTVADIRWTMRRNFEADLWSQLAKEARGAAVRIRRQPMLKRQILLIAARYTWMAHRAKTDAAPRDQEQKSE
jgi:hypothetical protein